MLKRKALRKIFMATLSVFIALVIYIIPNKISTNVIYTNKEIEFIKKETYHKIYLLNDDNFLVEHKILIENMNDVDKIKCIISNLMISNKKNPDNLKGLIPVETKLLSIDVRNNIIHLNFSKELLNISEEIEESLIESLVYSLCNIKNIKGLSIYVEGNTLEKTPSGKNSLPPILNKSYGINKIYNLSNNKDIIRTDLYYVTKINNQNYYVPVTKYMNDDRNKIEIIIESLTSNYIYENNLMSFLNKNIKLNSYKIDEGIFVLELNDKIFSNKFDIKEEVEYTLMQSVFNSYDVDSVLLLVKGMNFSKKYTRSN
ncbi:MAG: GerMN domain-containing protein [Bacilli bacterium]